jgi:1-aminocyclopropane-1-carboxylate deaminase/D-cysteine desulfhydrase-like pyridoxal-dependent ACC family enzyme
MAERAEWVRYPTPIVGGGQLGTDLLWIKNDGLSGVPYGGNKARKLTAILARAGERGAKRLVTAGGAGSHHVLATTLYGKMRGYPVAAWVWPQKWTAHAEATLKVALDQGLDARPVGSAPMAVARLAFSSRDEYAIAIGGFGLDAAIEYAAAVRELEADIARSVLPIPDEIVVAVGTGSTAAGLLAGLVHIGLESVLAGVTVSWNPLARAMILSLAGRTLAALGDERRIPLLGRQLRLDVSRVGGGYGHPTEEGERATDRAGQIGLGLDPTYTAKAFAHALTSAGARGFSPDPSGRRAPRPLPSLYWHTLSARPLPPLVKPVEGAERARRLSGSLFRDRPSSLT